MQITKTTGIILLFGFTLLLVTGCAPRYTSKGNINPPPTTVVVPNTGATIEGIASFYSYEFAGRKTANGEVFDPLGITAAHREWPFNTMVEVTSKTTGKSVIVRINDRGPFTACIIDLSLGSAKKIGMVQNTPVSLKVISVGPTQ